MEVSSSAITGAMRVGVQVVSSHKAPVLEIYHQVRNRIGPEFEYETPKGVSGEETIKQKTGIRINWLRGHLRPAQTLISPEG